jgi:hypothetical protein
MIMDLSYALLQDSFFLQVLPLEPLHQPSTLSFFLQYSFNNYEILKSSIIVQFMLSLLLKNTQSGKNYKDTKTFLNIIL